MTDLPTKARANAEDYKLSTQDMTPININKRSMPVLHDQYVQIDNIYFNFGKEILLISDCLNCTTMAAPNSF